MTGQATLPPAAPADVAQEAGLNANGAPERQS